MANNKFLDSAGLTKVWNKIKSDYAKKTDVNVLRHDVDTLASLQIPESVVKKTVEDYANAHSAGFATKIESLHTYGTVITSSNYSTLLPNLDYAERNSIILIASGLPNIEKAPGEISGGTLITFNPYTDETGTVQLLINSGGSTIYFRNRWSSWNEWQMMPQNTKVESLVTSVLEHQERIRVLESRDGSVFSAMFSKVLCIGDSLTQGAYYGSPYISKIGKNFPNMFCRMGNIGGNNEGYSGITPKEWYATKKKTSYNDWDLIILWLGTNEGLTDTLASDVNAHSDYHDYADTNTGCYCKIIESIKESNPSANIVMLNCFATSGNIATTRKVLAEISAKYGLPLFETEWLSIANDTTYSYHAGVNNVHLGVFGAWTLAKKLWMFLAEYYTTHWIDLENGNTANLNPTAWEYINR